MHDKRTITLCVSSPFSATEGRNFSLDQEFKAIRYTLTVTLHDARSFSYAQDTDLQINGQPALFHHVERNTLTRVQ
jgi:hypothetical protein